MSDIVDDKTPHLGLPLPNIDNALEDDVGRLRGAFKALDEAVRTRDESASAASNATDEAIKSCNTELSKEVQARQTADSAIVKDLAAETRTRQDEIKTLQTADTKNAADLAALTAKFPATPASAAGKSLMAAADGKFTLGDPTTTCVKQGWHTIFLPALSFFDPHDKRQPELTEAGAWSSWSRMYGLTFSPTSIQGGQAEFIFPAAWDRGVTRVDLLWSPQVAWGGSIRWNIYTAHAASTHPTASDGVRHAIGWSNSIVGSVHTASVSDIGWGTVVPGDVCRVFAYRVANADDDTLACAVHLLGVIIYYKTNKADDS